MTLVTLNVVADIVETQPPNLHRSTETLKMYMHLLNQAVKA